MSMRHTPISSAPPTCRARQSYATWCFSSQTSTPSTGTSTFRLCRLMCYFHASRARLRCPLASTTTPGRSSTSCRSTFRKSTRTRRSHGLEDALHQATRPAPRPRARKTKWRKNARGQDSAAEAGGDQRALSIGSGERCASILPMRSSLLSCCCASSLRTIAHKSQTNASSMTGPNLCACSRVRSTVEV